MTMATIPAGVDFLKTLAEHVRQDAATKEIPLSDYMILLPTRRAVRSLTELFFPDHGATWMPRMHALGDLEEDVLTLQSPGMDLPPAISPTARRGLLMGLLQELSPMPWRRRMAMADALAKLLDESHLREVPLTALEHLIPGEMAQHWEKSMHWLRVVSVRWPEILAQRGQMDAADLRQRVLKSYAALWREQPPAHPVIAAGSTGSLPATRALLKTIAELPKGQVILPALDLHMPNEVWQNLPPSHPQYAMQQFLSGVGAARHSILVLGNAETQKGRLWQEILLPAEATANWRAPERRLIKSENDWGMLDGLCTVSAPHGDAEAAAIAVILSGWVAEGKTAACITPDRGLAQRVAAHLSRYGITANDSAGQSLAQSTAGAWVRLFLQFMRGGQTCADLFYLLNHPYSCFGTTRDICRTAARQMAKAFFHRTDAPQDLQQLLSVADDGLPLRDVFLSLRSVPETQGLEAWVPWLQESIQRLTTPPDAPANIMTGDDGEALAEMLQTLSFHAHAFAPMGLHDFESLCAAEMAIITLHPVSSHVRLHILGPLESRLHAFDGVVLAGMNEGTWPAASAADPWLSRPMRQQIAMGLPDERIGLSAHDFFQLACQPAVCITRAVMDGGAPTVPSRWWQRLAAYLQACGLPEDHLNAPELLTAAAAMDAPAQILPATRPMPVPRERPARFSPSSLKTLLRNPYAFYAQKILRLHDLPDLMEPPAEREQGEWFHKVFEVFTRDHPATLPSGAAQILDRLAESHMAALALSGMEREFWQQHFINARDQFLTWQDAALSAGRKVVAWEEKLSRTLATRHGEVVLHAQADRIDRDAHGAWVIVDYKRGNAPSKADILSLEEPQLVMEGWLLRQDPSHTLSHAEIWPLIKEKQVIPDAEAYQAATAEFEATITPFLEHVLNPQTPFAARVVEKPFDNEKLYAHLARTAEWQGRAA